SALALTYRLHDIGMLSDWHYRTACIELGRRGFRSSEPQGTPREISQLLDKIFRLLRKRGIGRADIAAELHIGTNDINDYIFGLTMTAVDGSKDTSHPSDRSIRKNLTDVSAQDHRFALCPWCHQRHDMD